MGGVVRKAKKLIRKAIPKELKPALPYIAAYYGGPLLASKSAFLTPAVSKALIAGTTSAVADERGDPLRAAALAAAPDVISGGLRNVAGRIDPNLIADSDEFIKVGKTAAKTAGALSRASEGIKGASALKTIGTQTSIDSAAKLAEIQQDQIDAYNRELQERGIMNKVKRRQSIFDIYINAGYDPDYVNSVLDKYGYADGGIAYLANGGLESDAEEMLKRFSTGFRNYKGKMEPMKAMFGKKKKPKRRTPEVVETEKGQIILNIPTEDEEGDQNFDEALARAREGIEMAYKTPGPAPTPFMKFAKGGEVEVEEETEDLGIMDFMKDQGIPYGEMASNIENDKILEQLFEKYLDMGLSPKDAAEAARQEFERMSQKPREGIMQMASGYKSDIEEMYEQYVFEMEEMGLQPMSFSEFLARERAGMKDGGKVKRRKKGEPMDDDGKKPGSRLFPKVPKGEFFLDKMPKPKRREGILEAADGGEVSIGQIEMLIKRGADNDLIKTYVEGAQDGVIDQIREAMDKRKNKKDGGIMEKDMRGGGFIPEGSKERADDVPARLSKNEFVMTADAVRAAGGGSVNKGAKRMYDLMYSLEGKI